MTVNQKLLFMVYVKPMQQFYSGQNVKAIAQRLGNTPAMIYEIYGHVMKELEEQAAEVFSKSVEYGTGASSGAN